MVVGEVSTGADVLVIGGGPAGYRAAIRAAQLDQDVVLVDRRDSLGGVCLNVGCIPSKALIHAADLFHEAGHNGVGVAADPAAEFDTLQEWRASVVNTLTSGVEMLEERFGVTVVHGEAYLKGPNTAHISGSGDAESVEFEHCILATGSSVVEIPGLEPDGETIITSTEALELADAPDRLLVVGGGYIGMELGTVYRKFGSEVTVVEAGDRILQGNPKEVVQPVERRAEELGIDILTGTKATDADVSDGEATVTLDTGNGEETRTADAVLVAVGRTPNSDDVGLENTAIETDDRGFIETDDQLRTAEDTIFAAGDVAGEPMLAHKGYQDGKVAAEVIAGEASAADFTVPAVIYTDPEVATVGMTADEAQEAGYEVITGSFSMGASGRAATMDTTVGGIHVVADAETEMLLGVHMAGPHVSELVGEATLALEMGARIPDIAMTVHPHPTISEAFREACEDAVGEAVHKYNPQG